MRYLTAIMFSLACFSCSPSTPSASMATNVRGHLGPVITKLISRHQTIIVCDGTSGPTYSLESAVGKAPTEDMTISELAMKNPELYDRVKSMQDNLLWAGLDK